MSWWRGKPRRVSANFGESNFLVGERGRNRTFNLLIKSQLLCQLSYAPERLGSTDEPSFRVYHFPPLFFAGVARYFFDAASSFSGTALSGSTRTIKYVM